MQEEEGRIPLIVMRRTFPFEPIEPDEPFPVVIKERHAPWANPETFIWYNKDEYYAKKENS